MYYPSTACAHILLMSGYFNFCETPTVIPLVLGAFLLSWCPNLLPPG